LASPLLLVLTAVYGHALPHAAQPAVKIQLADIGFQGMPQALLEAGASMLTVHFADSTHLLVTYGLRGLVERIPDDPPDHNDRAVGAVLVELPSGKVLARARWHLHDHGQYLWSLGGGRFLLRTSSTLTSIAPLANLASTEPFQQTPFIHVPGVIDAVLVSPEGDLVTVEASTPRKPHAEHPVLMVHNDEPKEPTHEMFYFVRAMGAGTAESPVRAVAAGALRTPRAGLLPVNGRGYLLAHSEKRSRWTMQFDSFDGETRDLSYVDSSCPPRMQFVSPSQFVVFSCRGSDDKIMISAFNFASRETWEEPLGGATPFAHFAFAQQAGRFALSRMVTTLAVPSLGPGSSLAPLGSVGDLSDPASTQEVRIYQVESGDLLLKLACVPVSRSGQNFDLSADGLSALVVRDGAIEIYRLPPPSARDKKDLAEIRALEPPLPHTELVKLTRMLEGARIDEPAVSTAESTQPAAPKAAAADANVAAARADAAPPVAAPAAAVAAVPASPAGDAAATAGDVETHRKPPSLLNPGETIQNAKAPKE
jgi:hypothetical protein